MSKVTFQLKGLGCADCAAKIEQSVGRQPNIKSASLNFTTGALRVDYENQSPAALRDMVTRIVRNHEPGGAVELSGEENRAPGQDIMERLQLPGIFISAAFFAAGLFLHGSGAAFVLMLLSFLVAGWPTIWRALRNIARGRIFDENFLMTVASAGAFAIGEYPEGAAVMLFYQIGEYFQDLAVRRSRRSISELLDIKPEFARVLRQEGEVRISPDQVQIGETILVRPGEKIPLDGQILTGNSTLDTSALTGESLPREVTAGDEVLSGCVNLTGVLQIRTVKRFAESTVSKILALVEEAGSRKAPAEQFITKFSRYYTPAVVAAAALIALVPPLFAGGFSDYLHRALVFLVVSCPCALVLSVPLSFFAGIGAASRKGVLIKGGSYLEALSDAHTMVFDKTGTLTEGKFTLTGVYPVEISEEELLRTAAHAECHSNHPIRQSIWEAYRGDVRFDAVSDYREHSGLGVSALFEGRRILAGNRRLMEREGISPALPDPVGTVVHVARDGVYLGCLVISDRVRTGSQDALHRLHEAGVTRLVMLTGDNEGTAKAVAGELELDEYRANLLPHQKVKEIEALQAALPKGKKLLFTGDGINDAPSLARADIGVAMGGIGSDAAVEAADIVIMNDELPKLADALGIARKTRRIVWQNILFALGVKFLILILAAASHANMWAAVFADVGVSLIAIMNALRILRR